ncbi:unnamed protein product [Linum trigynum]|uniref:Uncharacterized protein n=1 Tax=Linum trigynum TaxID=586398 RepID=A0AAV2D3N2_9ROSI
MAEVEIISETCIKPSSPTPPHLQIYRFSSIDQRAPSSYMPTILFFNPPPPPVANTTTPCFTNQTISSSLKRSLSETLTRFYPLAGRTNPEGAKNLSIDCTDDGVRYVEARVNETLSHFLNHRVVNDGGIMRKLLPLNDAVQVFRPPPPGSHIVHIQVTFFPCGGLCLSSLCSHKIVDAPTMSSFYRLWSSSTAGGSLQVARDDSLFCAQSVFPHNEAFVGRASVPKPAMLTRAQSVPAAIRRFVFNASAIARLKEKCKPIGAADDYTISRVQAVTALLCGSILRAFRARSDNSGTTLFVQPVNLRARADPPLPANSFGNLTMSVTVRLHGGGGDEDTNLSSLARSMKESVSRIDAELIRRIRGEEGKDEFTKVAEEVEKEGEDAERHVMVNSFSRLGYYEIDFGWGRPVWMACLCGEESGTAAVNLVLLNDTRSGEGLEAWVLLGVDDMAVLESDGELLSFVSSIDPSPLELVLPISRL